MDNGDTITLKDGHVLTCIETMRMLPGKRQVFVGDLDGSPVFAKLYLDPSRGVVHWQRELDGINAFSRRGVLTAGLLYADKVKFGDVGASLILLEYLADAVSIKQAWDQGDHEDRVDLLREMTRVLAQHHQAGLCQADLHLGNFVISEGRIYSLDGAGVGMVEGELELMAGLDNLALFLAQLLPGWMESAPEVYDIYLAQRGMEQGPGVDYLLRQIKRSREWRWNKFKGKLFRDCTAIRYRESAGRIEIVARSYVSPELELLLKDPDASFPGRKRALKNGSSCTVWAARAGERSLVVKRYNDRGWLKGLLQKAVRGRALVSWENAHLLGFYGILTARPVAVLRLDGGDSRVSYFLTEEINGICLYYWLLDEARSHTDLRLMAQKVVEVFVQLYNHKITHGDMKVANWLVDSGEVVLIDLDSMRKHRDGLRFRWLWRSDVRRFMRNWKDLPELNALFRDELQAQGLDWK